MACSVSTSHRHTMKPTIQSSSGQWGAILKQNATSGTSKDG